MKKLLLSLMLLLPVAIGAQEKDLKQIDDIVSNYLLTRSEQFTNALGDLTPYITPMFDEEDLEYWAIYSKQRFQEDMRLYVVSYAAKYLTDEDVEQLGKTAKNESLMSAMNKMEKLDDVFSSPYMQKFLGWFFLMMNDPSAAASKKPQVPCTPTYKAVAMKFLESEGMQMQIQMLLENKKEQIAILDGQLQKVGYSLTGMLQDVYLSMLYETGITEQELRMLTVVYNSQAYVHLQKGISEMVAKKERIAGYIFKRFYLYEAQEKMKQSN